MAPSEVSHVFTWEIRAYNPEAFANLDWKRIQTALAREFIDAVWKKINATVLGQIEMTLIPWIEPPRTVELLAEISAVAQHITPQAKGALYSECWKIFTERFWPGIRTRLEALIRSGKPGSVDIVTPHRLAFTIQFDVPAFLFPPAWKFSDKQFSLRDIALEGITPIIVSLDPPYAAAPGTSTVELTMLD